MVCSVSFLICGGCGSYLDVTDGPFDHLDLHRRIVHVRIAPSEFCFTLRGDERDDKLCFGSAGANQRFRV